MGLFTKKAIVDPVDFLALRAELQDVKARLETSEQAKVYLEARLGSLDATTTAMGHASTARTEEFGSQISSLQERVNAAVTGSATADPVGSAVATEEMRARVDALAASAVTVDRVAQQLEELSSQVRMHAAMSGEVDALNSRVGELQANAGATDAVRLRVDQLAEQSVATDAIAAQLAQLAERVAISANDARQAKEQTYALDARIAAVGTELTNQLSELGTEIDALAAARAAVGAAPQAEVSDEVIAAVRAGQTRLANEQARYEIAFREDLATLAEQVRLLRGGR